VIPLVAASEAGAAQSESLGSCGVARTPAWNARTKVFLERSAREGDSPVCVRAAQDAGVCGVVLLGNAVRTAGIPLPRLNIMGRPIANK